MKDKKGCARDAKKIEPERAKWFEKKDECTQKN